MEPSQMRKEVESLIRTLGGPNDPALIARHPKSYKRGTVLIKPPVNDCLQRAVERVEGKILAAAEVQQREREKQEDERQKQLRASQLPLGGGGGGGGIGEPATGEQQSYDDVGKSNDSRKVAPTSSLHPDFLTAISPENLRRQRARSAGGARNNNNDNYNSDNSPSSSSDDHRRHRQNHRGTPSPGRCAVMSFRSNARLFLGKHFPCGSVDSPGPIYEQKGFGIDTVHGQSFCKARRDPASVAANNAGPAYTGVPSIGKQFLSVRENPTNVVFSKSGRFGEVKENERMKNRGKGPYQVPGPGAYHSDIGQLPHHRGKAYSPAPSLGVRHSSSTFISKSHFADYQGRCSPGPMYDVSGMERGVFPPSKAPTFGKGERIPLSKKDRVPGPGAYSPDDKETVIQGPVVGFARSRRMAANTTDSPGPIYSPSYEFAEKCQHVVRIGHGPEEDRERERFNCKIHLGKKLVVDAVGRDSPGPMYNPERKWDGPSYTIQFKEKRVRPSLFPRPERARWISEQNAKENLGAWSPGPKYDTRGDITKEGIVFSFTGSSTNREQQQQQQQQYDDHKNSGVGSVVGANIASTSSSQHGDSSNVNNNKSGAKKGPSSSVPFYDTDVTVLSTTKPIHSVLISPITKRKTPGHGGDTSRTHQHSNNHSNAANIASESGAAATTRALLFNPRDELCHPSAPSFSFGTGDRSSSIWQTHQDKNQKGGSTVSGSGMLNINYCQVEQGSHGPRLGGLSLPGL